VTADALIGLALIRTAERLQRWSPLMRQQAGA
jgi:hypothetical protein